MNRNAFFFLPVTNISTFIRLQKTISIAAFFQTAEGEVFDHVTPIEIGKKKVTKKRSSLLFASLGNPLAS